MMNQLSCFKKLALLFLVLGLVFAPENGLAKKKKKKKKAEVVNVEPACDVTITGTDAMKFDRAELLFLDNCKELTLKLVHSGKLPKAAMGHNVVITKKDDMQAIVSAAIAAGPANEYVPKDNAKVLAATKVIGGGESTEIKIDPKKLMGQGDLVFFCSFPGHAFIMKGTVLFKSAAK